MTDLVTREIADRLPEDKNASTKGEDDPMKSRIPPISPMSAPRGDLVDEIVDFIDDKVHYVGLVTAFATFALFLGAHGKSKEAPVCCRVDPFPGLEPGGICVHPLPAIQPGCKAAHRILDHPDRSPGFACGILLLQFIARRPGLSSEAPEYPVWRRGRCEYCIYRRRECLA
jgi:hypothetical protein